MSDILVIGSLNADIVARVKRAPQAGETVTGDSLAEFCGGKGANQAYAAGRLGGTVAMLGCVGGDERGERQKRNLESVGVSVEWVHMVEGEITGSALIAVEDGGENRIIVIPGANDAYRKDCFEGDQDKLDGARFALLQLETPLETVAAALKAAKARGAVTMLDPAPARPLADDLLVMVDYLTPNLSELRALSGQNIPEGCEAAIERASRLLLTRGVGKVVAKLGAGGAMLVDETNMHRVAGFEVEVVDTTAAGDCFNAAFAVALCDGKSEVDSLRFACAAAALSVTCEGAQSSLPNREEVELFLQREGR